MTQFSRCENSFRFKSSVGHPTGPLSMAIKAALIQSGADPPESAGAMATWSCDLTWDSLPTPLIQETTLKRMVLKPAPKAAPNRARAEPADPTIPELLEPADTADMRDDNPFGDGGAELADDGNVEDLEAEDLDDKGDLEESSICFCLFQFQPFQKKQAAPHTSHVR